jgi:hypothetical protein
MRCAVAQSPAHERSKVRGKLEAAAGFEHRESRRRCGYAFDAARGEPKPCRRCAARSREDWACRSGAKPAPASASRHLCREQAHGKPMPNRLGIAVLTGLLPRGMAWSKSMASTGNISRKSAGVQTESQGYSTVTSGARDRTCDSGIRACGEHGCSRCKRDRRRRRWRAA